MTDFYGLFNEKLDEFFSDLVIAFPDIKDFRHFKTGLKVVVNITPKRPQIIFRDYVLNKYRDAILSKDEEVFLNESKFEIYVYDNSHDYWEDFINKLKQIWRSLDGDNKEAIWRYFHVLLVLSDKCP